MKKERTRDSNIILSECRRILRVFAFDLPAAIALSVCFLACSFGSLLHAQAWVRDTSEIYLKISYGSSTASEQYSFDGSLRSYADNVEGNAFFDRSLYLYGEYGLTPDLTLVASLPYRRLIVRDAAFRYRTFAFGDLGTGVRVDLSKAAGLEEGRGAAALNVGVTTPTGYTRNLRPSVGAGQINMEGSLFWGSSFYPFPAYVQAGLGYRHRTSLYQLSDAVECKDGIDLHCFADSKPEYGDEIFGSIESGITIRQRLFLQGIVTSAWSIKGPQTGFSVTNPIPTRHRVVKGGVGVAILLPWSLSASVQTFYTLAGQNTLRSLDVFLGVDLRFRAF